MDRWRVAIAYLGTLAYDGAFLAFAYWGPWPLGWQVVFPFVTVPAIVLGLISRGWAMVGVPLSMWAVVSIVTVVVVGGGEFGPVGLFVFMLMIYWPLLLLAFAVGKAVRYAVAGVSRRRDDSRELMRILQ